MNENREQKIIRNRMGEHATGFEQFLLCLRLLLFHPTLRVLLIIFVIFLININNSSAVTRIELAKHWAPVIYQKVDMGDMHEFDGDMVGTKPLKGRSDFITNFDFDVLPGNILPANICANNNWENLPNFPLNAYVYYDVKETESHWFVYYAVYHPKDWADSPLLGEHENDMEAMFFCIQKDKTKYGKLIIVESMAHNTWLSYPIDTNIHVYNGWNATGDGVNCYDENSQGSVRCESIEGRHRPIAYIEDKGHGIYMDEYSCTKYLIFIDDWDEWLVEEFAPGIIYKLGAIAEEPDLENDLDIDVTYVLQSIEELWNYSGPLWQDCVYSFEDGLQSFTGNDGQSNAAHPPWTIPDYTFDNCPPLLPKDKIYVNEPGRVFRDPAAVIGLRYDIPFESISYTYIINDKDIIQNADPGSLTIGNEIQFNGNSYPIASSIDGGLIVSWNFGDGEKGIGTKPTHIYKSSGDHDVQIRAFDSWGKIILFKSKITINPKTNIPPNTPILKSPGSNYEFGSDVYTTTPTFYWNSVADADHYGLYISKDPYGPNNIVYTNETLKGASFTLPYSNALSDGVKYRWDMTAFNSDGLQSGHSPNKFFTVNIDSPPVNYPPNVTVISPNGGENITVGNPYEIKWIATDNTGIIQAVNIYGSLNGGISWFTIASGETDDGSYTWTPSNTSAQFKIKVEAEDSFGEKGDDMSDGNFSVVSSCSAPSLPTLENISVSVDSYFVRWSPSSGVSYYNLQEDTSASFSSPTVVYSSSGTSWHSGIQSPGTYYYRVEAVNNCGSSGWSNPKSVAIQTTDQGPGAISALYPVDNAVNQPLNLTLSWGASHPGGESLRYNVYVVNADTTNFFPNNIKSYGQTAMTYNLTNLPYNTTVSWGIEAIDDTGDRKYSSMFHFNTISDDTIPTGSILINNGDATTTSYSVTLNLSASDGDSGVKYMRLSNDGQNWTGWTYYSTQYQWNLADTRYGGKTGQTTYIVYAQFRDAQNNESTVYNDSIDKVAGTSGNIILNGAFYQTIRDAMAAANSGDTIYLTEGIYTIYGRDNPPRYPSLSVGIVMKPGVTLMGDGAGKTTINLQTGLYAIIDADNSIVEGMTIINSNTPGTAYAVLLESDSSTINHCIIRDSSVAIEAGVNSTRQASNNIISNNLIINNNNGISNRQTQNISFFNNTIAYNNSGGIGISTYGFSVSIKNNIIAFNGQGISAASDAPAPIIYNNDVYENRQGNGNPLYNYVNILDQTGLNGNLSSDPLFINSASGDYHLNSGSPCINTGIDIGIPYNGSKPDMGAYEHNGIGTVAVTSNQTNASFTITAPTGNTYNGNGTNWSMSNLPIGIYHISFTPIANLNTPPYQSKMLYTGQTLTFDGTYTNDTVGPSGSISVDFDEYATADNFVTITFDITDKVSGLGTGSQMVFSNDGATWSQAEPYTSLKKYWDLLSYGGTSESGMKTVYAKVSDSLGNWTTFTDTILYAPNRQLLEVPTQYITIQAAIDAAQDGDMVHVLPGTYSENLVLKAGVRLQGSGSYQTLLNRTSSSPRIVTAANNSMIDGFTLGQTGGNPSILVSNTSPIVSNNIIFGGQGIQVSGNSKPIIRNNLFRTSFLGIYISGDNSEILATIENNTITSSTIGSQSSPTYGINIQNASPLTKVSVINNIVANNGIGIRDSSSDTTHQHIFSSFGTYWGNVYGNFSGIYNKMEAGDKTEDPMFVDSGNGNFRLQTNSPCINSGNPEDRYFDPDATKNDRGAYGSQTVNTEPVADFSIEPFQGSTTTVFTFDGSSSYDGETRNESLRLKWDLDGDGTYDTILSTNKIMVYRYDSPGTYNVTLQVEDKDGYTSTISKSVLVINQPPYVTGNLTPVNGMTNQDVNVMLRWDGGDPDIGDTVTYDVYFGTSSNPPLVSSGQSESYYNPGSLSSATTYYWKIISKDSYGDTTIGPLWYFVTQFVDDVLPIIEIFSPTTNNTYISYNENLSIRGIASDNMDVELVTWTNSRGGGSGTASGTTNWSVSGITLQSGTNVITVTARDAANNMGTDVLTVTYDDTFSSSPNLSIPDNTSGGIVDSIVISNSGSLIDLDVCVNVTHSWVGNLVLSLKHEETGTSVTIIDQPGMISDGFGCDGDDINATLDDEASSYVENVCATTIPTIIGTFQPNNPLSAFDSEDLSGTWTMTVSDNVEQDTGILNFWCLKPTLALESVGVWVDFAYIGIELGTQSRPYNTLAEAINAVAEGGEIIIKAGITNETFVGIDKIKKRVTIKSSGGTAIIGRQ